MLQNACGKVVFNYSVHSLCSLHNAVCEILRLLYLVALLCSLFVCCLLNLESSKFLYVIVVCVDLLFVLQHCFVDRQCLGGDTIK